MKHFIRYNSEGEIVSVIDKAQNQPDPDTDSLVGTSDKFLQVEEGVSLTNHYVENGNVVPYTSEQIGLKAKRPIWVPGKVKWSNASFSWEPITPPPAPSEE